MQARIDKMGLYQAKKLLHDVGDNRVKTQPTEWEKSFIIYSF
jgi:hypothetical protein